ncbi:hypothetical protein [Paraburkholderia tropica]|uniref:hypothetical protein n=1 Tax=Paraburkholderia tropica TaxID=92647 RepID=UPI002AB6674E|nr:hypothetical protein [Paraburkholderia tropica]
MIRTIDTRTGAPLDTNNIPAYNDAKHAGAVARVLCDHEGTPIRDASGGYTKFKDPDSLSVSDRRAIMDEVRSNPNGLGQEMHVTAHVATVADAEAARAALAAKGYGAAALGNASTVGKPQHITQSEAFQREAQSNGWVVTPVKHPMAAG